MALSTLTTNLDFTNFIVLSWYRYVKAGQRIVKQGHYAPGRGAGTRQTGQANLPPSAGFQFFGEVKIDARSGDMVVALKDIDGVSVFSQRLHARQWDRYDD